MGWVDIAEDFVGSLIEIICTLVLLNLISSDYLRSKRNVFIGSVVVAGWIVFFDQWDAPLLFLLNYVAMFLVFTMMTKRDVIAVFFEVLIASIAIWAIEYPLVLLFNQVIWLRSLDFMGSLIQLMILLVCCLLVGLSKRLKRFVWSIYEGYRKEVYFITAMIFILSIIELSLWRYDPSEVYRNANLILVFAILWFGLSLILLKNMIDKKKQRESIRLHEQYMEMTERLLDRLYKEKHDFNKHLQTIQGICQCETPQEAVKRIELYLASLQQKGEQKEESAESLSIHTGNGIINALLYTKGQEAQEKDIQLLYVPSGIFPVFPCKEYELVQMIGNLLDNAIEYVASLEKEYRRVIININENDGKKQIEIRNPYFMDGKTLNCLNRTDVRSTKKGQRRGYGLTNVREIAAKCHGDFNLSYEGNEFIARILF